VAVANDLSAQWAFESFVPREEAGAVNAPHEFRFVCELSGCERGVSTMVGEICTSSSGCSEEVAMYGGVVEGNDSGGETVFSCISFEVGVDQGFIRVRLGMLSGVRLRPVSYMCGHLLRKTTHLGPVQRFVFTKAGIERLMHTTRIGLQALSDCLDLENTFNSIFRRSFLTELFICEALHPL
jgi:hypothetical protein